MNLPGPILEHFIRIHCLYTHMDDATTTSPYHFAVAHFHQHTARIGADVQCRRRLLAALAAATCEIDRFKPNILARARVWMFLLSTRAGLYNPTTARS